MTRYSSCEPREHKNYNIGKTRLLNFIHNIKKPQTRLTAEFVASPTRARDGIRTRDLRLGKATLHP